MHSHRCTSPKRSMWLAIALVVALLGSSGLPLDAAPSPPVPTIAPTPAIPARRCTRLHRLGRRCARRAAIEQRMGAPQRGERRSRAHAPAGELSRQHP